MQPTLIVIGYESEIKAEEVRLALLKLQRENVGFRADGVMTFELALPPASYPDGPSITRFFESALTEIRAVPGVQSAAAINYLPLANFGFNGPFTIEGRPPFPRDTAPVVEYRTVSPGYFRTMGIPLRQGRFFADGDMPMAAEQVAIIDEKFAQRFWPAGDAIGKHVWFDPARKIRIVSARFPS